MAIMTATITTHTTASKPRPHVVYFVDITNADGSQSQIAKRYSDVCYLLPLINAPGLTGDIVRRASQQSG